MEKYFDKATLDEVFEKMTLMFKERTAIIFEERKITYDNLRTEAYNIAIKLKKLGVKKNDKIAILLPNCYDYLCLYFANFLIGAIVVPINSRVVKQELENIINNSDAKIVIFEDIIGTQNYYKIIDEIKPNLFNVKNYIVRGNSVENSMISFEEIFHMEENIEEKILEFEKCSIEEKDVALLAYTSGTTSTPKGVMITHGGLVNTSYCCGNIWRITYCDVEPDFVGLSVAPLYGAQGFLAVLIYLVSGVTMSWLSTFNPNAIIKAISNGKVSFFHTQPTMWSLLMSSPLLKFADFSKLSQTVVSGSVCSYNLAKRIQERTGSVLQNAYGLIEATGVVTMTRPDDSEDIRLNTVGRAIPGVEIKIVDNDGKEVKKGEVGEIATRGYLMRGYFKNEEKTREVIDEYGWLYTGDLGRFYKDTDNIQIVGRAKEMIIRGGFNIFPIDIEEQLLNYEKIQDASVVGKSDDILGECIVSFIVPKPGTMMSKGEVIKHCKEVLSNHKIPDEVYFVKQLPTILNGKVRKNVLKEWANKGIPEEEIYTF